VSEAFGIRALQARLVPAGSGDAALQSSAPDDASTACSTRRIACTDSRSSAARGTRDARAAA
jgi:hypothetical protein